MKFISIGSGDIGLLVELPTGTHVVDIRKSLGVFAAHSPVSGALMNGTLNQKPVWVALVKNWHYLRIPSALLARTAVANPNDPRLVLYPHMPTRQAGQTQPGIVALDISDATDLEMHESTARLDMQRQLDESLAQPAEPDRLAVGENVEVIDFACRNAPRPRR